MPSPMKPSTNTALSQSMIDRDGKRDLQPIGIDDIAPKHPVHLMSKVYADLSRACPSQFVPALEDVSVLVGRQILDYCNILVPVEADPYIDFIVQHIGRNTPGAGVGQLTVGDSFVGSLMPMFANERVMELASCLALKRPRLSKAYSARRSTLNVKVYRGVFPVWVDYAHQNAVIICIAPIHTTITTDAEWSMPTASGREVASTSMLLNWS